MSIHFMEVRGVTRDKLDILFCGQMYDEQTETELVILQHMIIAFSDASNNSEAIKEVQDILTKIKEPIIEIQEIQNALSNRFPKWTSFGIGCIEKLAVLFPMELYFDSFNFNDNYASSHSLYGLWQRPATIKYLKNMFLEAGLFQREDKSER